MGRTVEVYRVRNWSKDFETAETRKLKHLRWIPVPNQHDSLGYCALVDGERGAEHYAAWIAILQVASRVRHKALRGYLVTDDGRGLTPADLAIMTRLPERIFQEAIPRLCSPEVAWLEVVPANELADALRATGIDLLEPQENLLELPGIAGGPPGIPGAKGMEGKGLEWDGTEGKGRGKRLRSYAPRKETTNVNVRSARGAVASDSQQPLETDFSLSDGTKGDSLAQEAPFRQNPGEESR